MTTVEDVMVYVKERNTEANIRAFDSTHYSIDKATFKAIAATFLELLSQSDLNHEVFDCDDFALVFKSVVSLQGLKDGKNYACGILGVKQTHAFAGVPKGELHQLNIIILEGAAIVVEPQAMQGIHLTKYKNQNDIIELTF